MAVGRGPANVLVAGLAAVIALTLGSVLWREPGDSTTVHHPLLARLGVERVLVLRLARLPSRSEGLVHDAKRLGLPLDFLEATDGLLNESFRSRVLPLHAPEGTCADLIGAIFDTHERAWAVAATGTRPTLVLEDDVRLPHDFARHLAERVRALPEGFHLALVGSSVTFQARRLSPSLSRPDADDANKQAILGLWAYVISPEGARHLQRLVARERRGNHRVFQPVDLFVAHRLREVAVYVLEAPEDLAKQHEQRPDRHHVLDTMRQVGLVTLSNTPSSNQPAEDAESAELRKQLDRVTEDGRAGRFMKSWRTALWALRFVRRYSCWHIATLLQNAGLSLLRLLQERVDGVPELGGANGTLLAALEAFGSSARYNEGTWMARQKLSEFPEWVHTTLRNRRHMGFPPAVPPGGWESPVQLPNVGWLDLRAPWLQELLPESPPPPPPPPTTTRPPPSEPPATPRPVYDKVGTFAGSG